MDTPTPLLFSIPLLLHSDASVSSSTSGMIKSTSRIGADIECATLRYSATDGTVFVCTKLCDGLHSSWHGDLTSGKLDRHLI